MKIVPRGIAARIFGQAHWREAEREMGHCLAGRVIAIPRGASSMGAAVAQLIAEEEGDLVLGAATAAQVKVVDAALPASSAAYAVQLDLDRPKSVDEFFRIAIGQFGHVDAIVLESTKLSPRGEISEKTLALGARRMLHCLDAALRHAAGDLHVINIAPVAGRYAIPVATAFLGAKLATSRVRDASAPVVRMSVISAFDGAHSDEGAVARTVLHTLREARMPDVSEAILGLRRDRARGGAKSCAKRSNITVAI
jgi:NADP-dependent 3-hydroxy acid dehydrogenase YdfG